MCNNNKNTEVVRNCWCDVVGPRQSAHHTANVDVSPFTTTVKDSKTKGEKQNPQNDLCILYSKILKLFPTAKEASQYLGVILSFATFWGAAWFVFGDNVCPGSFVFDMALVSIVGYIFGHFLERYTTLTPVVGMTLVGAVYRNVGGRNFLDDKSADLLDFHLRRVYPVIILTRGALCWDWSYIRSHPERVFSLATLPWTVEWLTIALLAHILLQVSWYWALHLGSILASVSPAVVIPTVRALHDQGFGTKNQIALLVTNAGSLDTAMSEGMFGVINSAIFYPTEITYKVIKAFFAILLGIGAGVFWGVLIDCLPSHKDVYAPTIRSALILSGGLLFSYAAASLGWGGTSGVCIMVCAGTAASRWSFKGWPVNNNPVSEVYKLLWRIFEPMLFTISGCYLETSSIALEEFGLMMACICGGLVMRLLAAFLVALANNLTTRESVYVAITWMPKAIVEAVLVRVAADSIAGSGYTKEDARVAKLHSNIIVIAILLTSTLGSGLATILGPVLLPKDSKDMNDYDASQKPVAKCHNVSASKNTHLQNIVH